MNMNEYELGDRLT